QTQPNPKTRPQRPQGPRRPRFSFFQMQLSKNTENPRATARELSDRAYTLQKRKARSDDLNLASHPTSVKKKIQRKQNFL
ncbi:hypothetical protein, partial [Methylocella sp.]|uniref:hypothetical protein n=1 Tax=Methylocella sp. TaxID=1978226 RepID=UPI003782E3E6